MENPAPFDMQKSPPRVATRIVEIVLQIQSPEFEEQVKDLRIKPFCVPRIHFFFVRVVMPIAAINPLWVT